jgi:hypothetical protein
VLNHVVPLPEAVLGEVMLGEELDVVEEETIASYVVEANSAGRSTKLTTGLFGPTLLGLMAYVGL